jgi:hypothetical protein
MDCLVALGPLQFYSLFRGIRLPLPLRRVYLLPSRFIAFYV